MNVLIVGSGGREHALAYKAALSALVTHVFVAPGNAGTTKSAAGSKNAGMTNIDIAASDIESLIAFAKKNEIGLTIVGPEQPLVAGIVDAFSAAGLACFGPTQSASTLEGSKTFAKEFLERHQIPTARYQSFTQTADALEYLATQKFPVVIKADGLAAGKGVVIAHNFEVGQHAIEEMLSGNRFGEAGHRVVIEEFMEGEEASFICIVSGTNVLPMASSQDHKAAFDHDQGPNTGGMGAYSPAPIVDEGMTKSILDKVIYPTVNGLQLEGTPYIGFLYAGLMIGSDNIPRVVEFNCRFGDPEAQPVLSRLKSDLVSHCLAAVEGRLSGEVAQWDERCCLGVVMAADGYPESYTKGARISGLDLMVDNTEVFHAGTQVNDSGEIATSGGRVLCVTGFGDTVREAQKKAYQRVSHIDWQGAWYRSDIGYRAVQREQE
ncbi:MAG: phosphoribosylamine--glycine ligase [Acidiferrobacterales bacterium]|nr:phosphoribosylamine--glycine ligase [Acidiferrobacterales bacterium]